MFTRQHYNAIADDLYEARRYTQEILEEAGRNPYEHEGIIGRVVSLLAARFERDNPNFDRERFEKAVYRDYEE